MSLPTKDELGAKLLEYPLLRQLLYERWFRLAFARCVLVFIFLGLFLPKIWRTSHPEFRPVIKVSGLDLVQAWSLKRTALRAAAEGKFDEANYAWQAALANNRADPILVRGALQNLIKNPHRRQHAAQGIQEALWLLKLTGTNLVDLELAAQVLTEFRYSEFIIGLVEPRLKELTPSLASAYLKALFNVGQMQTFDARWRELSPKMPNDPELALYRAAYLVGWGPPETMTSARQQLDAAMEDPAHRLLADRLKLTLSAHELNAEAYGQTLKKLEEWREDTLNYHLGYWRLLATTGRKAEAAQLAKDYPHPPASALEAAELAQTYAALDMHEAALQVLQRYSRDFGHAAVFWITYANELVDSKRWEDLRNIALQIRAQDMVRDQLAGFSYFLEGRAELALNREADARTAFVKAAEHEFTYPTLGQKVATQLAQFGYPDLARQVLLRLENRLKDEASYWGVVFRVADQLKDTELLVKAATHAYQLSPKDPTVVNNYAAALLINRQHPEEVIKLTLQLLSQSPNSLHAVVNHSAALLLNNRPREAEALLGRVRTNNLTSAQLALYNLDLFETYLSLHEFDRAWSVSDLIDANRLYPTQRRWLEQARQQLPARQSKEG